MSAPARRSMALPFYILLLALITGAFVWHGYNKWQEEQAIRRGRMIQQAAPAAPQAPAPQGAPQAVRPAAPEDAYRSLPTYFIAGFGALMALILGTILYLWWSLKDLEGGKRYGEETMEGEPEEKG